MKDMRYECCLNERGFMDRLLTAQDVADMLGVTKRHVWTLEEQGRMPPAIRSGRIVRWKEEVIQAWVSAGCPENPKKGVTA